MDFPTKEETTEKKEAKKDSFLTEKKAEHQALFDRFPAMADEYKDVAEYTAALQKSAWELTEAIAN